MARRDQVKAGLIEWQVVATETPDLEQIVDEVEYALYPPKHEGKLPTYGCIVTTECPLGNGIEMVPADLGREMADGVATFAISCGGKRDHIALLDSAHDEELQLIDLSKRFKGILVHRNAREIVRVFAPKAIHIYEAGEWKVRPYADSVLADVTEAVPQAGFVTLNGLLTVAFHVLSPSNVGTTLIWWLDNVDNLPQGGTSLSMLAMNVKQKNHYPAIRSLLRKHDGAVFVSPDGRLLTLGFQLKYSDIAASIISQTGGTRHTSAKRFSYDEPRVVAVTVSEDGPVSVFSDGIKVTELEQTRFGATADYLANLVPEKQDDVETFISRVTCPNCGKHLEVEVVILYGWRDHETAQCPVCDATVYEMNCWKLIPRLIKRLPAK
jgi:DNA integrity scanning protein DisA with diadenylate cyclase activity